MNSLSKLSKIVWREPDSHDARRIYSLVHSKDYIENIYRIAESAGPIFLDPDTYVTNGTIQALNRLAGAVREAIELVSQGESYLFILGRPPGHHAGIKGPALGAPTLGFCIFNTAAVIAKMLAESAKVAVLDFDLHHGNGTQEILWNTEILHVDIHQDPSTIYPGTGFPWQKGANDNLVNILLPPGTGDDIFMDAVNRAFEKIVEYDPEFLVVSAGFDAYYNDYTVMRITNRGFHYVGAKIRDMGIPVVAILEGGYSIGLSKGLPAFVRGLIGEAQSMVDSTSSGDVLWDRYRRLNRVSP
ncbi:MAG: histone deacetylase family protein [Desulfurococcales archaeon]|nr:histone deacetylase family protein [Desulfurococcales archaeon]